MSVDAPDPCSNAHKDWIVTTGMKNPEAYHHKLMRKKISYQTHTSQKLLVSYIMLHLWIVVPGMCLICWSVTSCDC